MDRKKGLLSTLTPTPGTSSEGSHSGGEEAGAMLSHIGSRNVLGGGMGYFRGAAQGGTRHTAQSIHSRFQQLMITCKRVLQGVEIGAFPGCGFNSVGRWWEVIQRTFSESDDAGSYHHVNTQTIKCLMRFPWSISKALDKLEQSRCKLRLWCSLNRAVILNDPRGCEKIWSAL